MKLFPLAEFADDDVCSPHEMNLELGSIAQEVNGNLDVENIAAEAVTSAKFARSQDWFRYTYLTYGGVGTSIDVNRNSKGEVHRLRQSNLASNLSTMEIYFEATEGAIVIRGGATVDSFSGDAAVWSLVFLVDGRIVWESGTLTCYSKSSRDGETSVFVGAGTVKVEMAIRVFDDELEANFVAGNLFVKQYGV